MTLNPLEQITTINAAIAEPAEISLFCEFRVFRVECRGAGRQCVNPYTT
jgi:hypothetical protein